MKIEQSANYKPTAKQRDFGAALGRQIRDLGDELGIVTPSASTLAKYYEIDDLKAALAAMKRGETVEF